jgi:alginate O-acetyltransferase complex protein AlgI
LLFSSYEFVLLFVPVVLTGFFLTARVSEMAAALWLAAASLFFYGWWNSAFVLLLLASIAFNYGMGYAIAQARSARASHTLLVAAIAVNLLLLGYFKYVNFFISTANQLTNYHFRPAEVVLPLGISFFTFTQIAFLVDVRRGIAHEYNFVHYLLFVTYFPHLIAGPVLHHKQMMPQFSSAATYRFKPENLVLGLAIFSVGLAKKVLMADSLGEYADPVFEAAGGGQKPMFGTAWAGALAYGLQLYFDFSGYSDMAIGVSMVLGVKLPINFNSPYKATSIIEFWRRWHMTLSQFLRDYLYIPLGGNRHGPISRHINLMATMVLGGLWHGANWTFVAWGALHGMLLVINHAWRAIRDCMHLPGWSAPRIKHGVSCGLTFICVLVGWVLFRADSFTAAWAVISGMFGLNGISVSEILRMKGLHGLGWRFDGFFADNERLGILGFGWFSVLAGLALVIVWMFPNTQQIFDYDLTPRIATSGNEHSRSALWKPRLAGALLLSSLFALSLVSFSKASPFLYFQF